jgi:ferritin-like metal-binding protein YciE
VTSRSHLTKKQRYAEDADYRERLRARCRAWWAAHKDEINASRRQKRRSSGVSSYTPRKKQRYAEDPEYRARMRAYNRAWVAAHRDEINAQNRRRWAENPELRRKQRAYRARSGRQVHLKHHYGLSVEEYAAMLARQGGACAICRERSEETLCVDHHHVTRLVRRLLCRRCNLGIGHFRDDPRLLRAAADYLEAFTGSGPPLPDRCAAIASKIVRLLRDACRRIRRAIAMVDRGLERKETNNRCSLNDLRRTTMLSKDKTLQDLFMEALKDIYSAEKQIVQALSKMVKTAQSKELADAFETHRNETQVQIGRLEQVFDMLGKTARAEACLGVQGIIERASEIAVKFKGSDALDAGLIAAAQAVEHYEITRYGTLTSWAKELGLDKAAKLLDETLEEEKKTDKLLTKLAEGRVNKKAA